MRRAAAAVVRAITQRQQTASLRPTVGTKARQASEVTSAQALAMKQDATTVSFARDFSAGLAYLESAASNGGLPPARADAAASSVTRTPAAKLPPTVTLPQQQEELATDPSTPDAPGTSDGAVKADPDLSAITSKIDPRMMEDGPKTTIKQECVLGTSKRQFHDGIRGLFAIKKKHPVRSLVISRSEIMPKHLVRYLIELAAASNVHLGIYADKASMTRRHIVLSRVPLPQDVHARWGKWVDPHEFSQDLPDGAAPPTVGKRLSKAEAAAAAAARPTSMVLQPPEVYNFTYIDNALQLGLMSVPNNAQHVRFVVLGGAETFDEELRAWLSKKVAAKKLQGAYYVAEDGVRRALIVSKEEPLPSHPEWGVLEAPLPPPPPPPQPAPKIGNAAASPPAPKHQPPPPPQASRAAPAAQRSAPPPPSSSRSASPAPERLQPARSDDQRGQEGGAMRGQGDDGVSQRSGDQQQQQQQHRQRLFADSARVSLPTQRGDLLSEGQDEASGVTSVAARLQMPLDDSGPSSFASDTMPLAKQQVAPPRAGKVKPGKQQQQQPVQLVFPVASGAQMLSAGSVPQVVPPAAGPQMSTAAAATAADDAPAQQHIYHVTAKMRQDVLMKEIQTALLRPLATHRSMAMLGTQNLSERQASWLAKFARKHGLDTATCSEPNGGLRTCTILSKDPLPPDVIPRWGPRSDVAKRRSSSGGSSSQAVATPPPPPPPLSPPPLPQQGSSSQTVAATAAPLQPPSLSPPPLQSPPQQGMKSRKTAAATTALPLPVLSSPSQKRSIKKTGAATAAPSPPPPPPASTPLVFAANESMDTDWVNKQFQAFALTKALRNRPAFVITNVDAMSEQALASLVKAAAKKKEMHTATYVSPLDARRCFVVSKEPLQEVHPQWGVQINPSADDADAATTLVKVSAKSNRPFLLSKIQALASSNGDSRKRSVAFSRIEQLVSRLLPTLKRVAAESKLHVGTYADVESNGKLTLVVSKDPVPFDPHPEWGERLESERREAEKQAEAAAKQAHKDGLVAQIVAYARRQKASSSPASSSAEAVAALSARDAELTLQVGDMEGEKLRGLISEAERAGVYAQVYGVHSKVLVVSPVPLPDYRAEYDPVWQRKHPLRLTSDSRRLVCDTLGVTQAGLMALQQRLGPEGGEDNSDQAPGGGSNGQWRGGRELVEVLDDASDLDEQEQGSDDEAAAAAAAAYEAERALERVERLANQRGVRNQALSKQLLFEQQSARERPTPKVAALQAVRQQLPAFLERQHIIDLLKSRQVLLVSGETGCGKSTQIPQFILEEEVAAGRGGAVRIVCTQPRRISAISLARRVAEEQYDGSVGDVVGYQVRGDTKISRRTCLTFCTTGVLLRRLFREPDLDDVTHIVVDEIHERKMNEDFLLIILRDLLPRRPDLKLVLMSATLNSEQFARYFDGCATLHIPGRTFPVQTFFLEDTLELTGHLVMTETERKSVDSAAIRSPSTTRETLQAAAEVRSRKSSESAALAERAREQTSRDWHLGYVLDPSHYDGYSRRTLTSLRNWMDHKEDQIHLDLIASVVEHVFYKEGPGAILIFLTGWDDISKMNQRLQAHPVLGNPSQSLLLPLHSSLPTEQQQMIFAPAPKGIRKVVMATNIAETSITIPDVVYVINAGKAKEKDFDVINKLATLLPNWITKASCKQRQGRAGRVQPGKAYHLFPRRMHDEHFKEHEIPELLRTPLTGLVLQIKYLGMQDAVGFLSRAISPPPAESVHHAIDLLQLIGALDARGRLTALGTQLAQLPVDPLIGKMMITACLFGCLDPVLTIASITATREPFMSRPDSRAAVDAVRAKLAAENPERTYSDHLVSLAAYDGWRAARAEGGENAAFTYALENSMQHRVLALITDMRTQFAQLLDEIGFLGPPDEDQWRRRDRRFFSHRRLEERVQACSSNGGNHALVKGVMCAGLYPQVALVRNAPSGESASAEARKRALKNPVLLLTPEDGKVVLHPRSIAAVKRSRDMYLPQRWLLYSEKVKTTQLFLREATSVSDLALLLFGGRVQLGSSRGQASLSMGSDRSFQFECAPVDAAIVQILRRDIAELSNRRLEGDGDDSLQQVLVPMVATLLNQENTAVFMPRPKPPPKPEGNISGSSSSDDGSSDGTSSAPRGERSSHMGPIKRRQQSPGRRLTLKRKAE